MHVCFGLPDEGKIAKTSSKMMSNQKVMCVYVGDSFRFDSLELYIFITDLILLCILGVELSSHDLFEGKLRFGLWLSIISEIIA